MSDTPEEVPEGEPDAEVPEREDDPDDSFDAEDDE